MAVNLSPVGGVAAQFFTNTGAVLTGGKLYTYSAGTTTPAATYTSSLGVTAQPNPIVLDAAGRVPASGEIWLTDGVIYKFVLKDSNDVTIATYDNITGINSNFVNFTASQEIQTATAGQTVFNLTTMQYQPGTNSLTVYVDGVNQYGPGAQYAYIETDSDTVTFVSGLHVGASVKFTTTTQTSGNATDASVVAFTGFNGQTGTVQNLADDDGSNWIGFEPAGTGAVARSAQEKMRDVVSVFDFMTSVQIADVLAGTALVDVTTAIQSAIDHCVQNGNVLFMPAGNYLITDTINIPSFTQISGEHKCLTAKGYGVEPKGTRIKFAPTTVKSLFVASGVGPFGGFRSGYSIEGLYIAGNSTNSTGNSAYAFDVDSIIESNFQNIAVQYFRTGFRIDATINNRFQYVRAINCYVQCVFYAGGAATTDVWDQCYFSNAPIGIQTNDTCLGIRFTNCIFETLENYGVNLIKEVYGWSFINCYSEDVPSVNASGAMFRVGHDGSTLAGAPQLSVIGGLYGGSNASNLGSMVDVSATDGVILGGFQASRYEYGVKTNSSTQTGQVVGFGWAAANLTNQVSDASKIAGLRPLGNYNDGTRNDQSVAVNRVITPLIRGNAAGTAPVEIQGSVVYVGQVAALVDGVAAPATATGYAQLYVDIADGDLKVKFGDGTVKTIATD